MKEGLKPHRYTEKRSSLGPRQRPQEPRPAPPATVSMPAEAEGLLATPRRHKEPALQRGIERAVGRYGLPNGRNEMRDMPPIDMEAPSPRPSGGPGALVPACVVLRADGSLALRLVEGSSAEEREIVGRICLCQWMAVEPGFIPEIVEPVPAATKQ
jgi:hypothetical protein